MIEENPPITLSIDGIALANLYVTQQIILALVEKRALDNEAMQSVFESAKAALQRATASVSGEQADYILNLLWRGYAPTGGSQKH